MDQVMLVRPRVEEARREICRAGRRCGYCRVYPGPREVCEERGRAVQANSRPCRAYDQVTPEELAEFKEEMAEKQRAYYLAHKEEMAEKQRAKKTELRNALKAIEKLKVVDPELYKQLIEETQK